MFGIINFGAFLLAGILLNLTPGSDTMYILGRSISQGKKAGVLSALGISTGALLHTLFAALGLSIILACMSSDRIGQVIAKWKRQMSKLSYPNLHHYVQKQQTSHES